MKRIASPLPPGSTVGILGGGQLARMLALAAGRLGIEVSDEMLNNALHNVAQQNKIEVLNRVKAAGLPTVQYSAGTFDAGEGEAIRAEAGVMTDISLQDALDIYAGI